MVSILIADDNKDFGICMLNSIIEKNSDSIKVQGIATNGLEAYQKIKTLQPDIVLLDVEMPIMNGFQVIHKLSEEKYNLPKILLVTAFPVLINSFNESQLVDGIIFKPFDFTVLNNYLVQFCDEYNNDKLNERIINILSIFDFNTNSLGYSYLIECIRLCLEDSHYIKDFENYLYPQIAKIYNISNYNKVKWAVDKSIKSMFRYTKTSTLKKFFPNAKKLSPKVFIKKIVALLSKN